MAAEKMVIGIRREVKNRWERRCPLSPDQMRELIEKQGLSFIVQPSEIRAFSDRQYAEAGARINDDLSEAGLILAVKEVPTQELLADKAYLYFSHTIKGQDYNMPMLARLAELGCTLIDYEPITDQQGNRLLFFGRWAGIAGMIDTLWALGRRLMIEGIPTPFADIRPAHAYSSYQEARVAIGEVGRSIAENGLPNELSPLVVGIAGYGNTSKGAQEILNLLPGLQITASELLAGKTTDEPDDKGVIKVVFTEEDSMQPISAEQAFDLGDYYKKPAGYRSRFAQYLPYLTVLVNCIYWETKYPRLVTKQDVIDLYSMAPARLRVIGDITCDIDGSIQVNRRSTDSDDPVYVWDVKSQQAVSGFSGNGPVVLAVDNLPCELPRESTIEFGERLKSILPNLAVADLSGPLSASGIRPEVLRGVILYKGSLVKSYDYLQDKL